jgi:hypothetical protein
MLTISSGADVANETTVIPITILGIANLRESATADFNNQFPPAISNTRPRTIKSKFSKEYEFVANIYEDLLMVELQEKCCQLEQKSI